MRVCTPWSPAEDDIVRHNYPSYALMAASLTGRSYNAIKCRARSLNVSKTRHTWTAADRRFLLQKLAECAPKSEIQARFPMLAWQAIRSRANGFGCKIQRPRKAIFEPAITAVRDAARRRGLTLAELDRRAKSGQYFSKAKEQLMLRHVANGARVLGGDIAIEWSSDF